jgi:hypothetical protein
MSQNKQNKTPRCFSLALKTFKTELQQICRLSPDMFCLSLLFCYQTEPSLYIGHQQPPDTGFLPSHFIFLPLAFYVPIFCDLEELLGAPYQMSPPWGVSSLSLVSYEPPLSTKLQALTLCLSYCT